MPRDDDDPPETPKCLFCGERRDSRRYRLWGAVHLSTVEKRAFLSDVTTVTSEYRDIKRVSYSACRPCAKWAVRWAAVQFVGTFLLFAACFLAAAVFIPDKDRNVKIGMGVAAGLCGLLAGVLVVQSLFPDTDSDNHDGALRDRAARRLKAKGKGDTYFTEPEYAAAFLNKSGDEQKPDRPKTAAELLQSDDDDRPRRRRRQ